MLQRFFLLKHWELAVAGRKINYLKLVSCCGCTVVRWLALSPDSRKVSGLNPGSDKEHPGAFLCGVLHVVPQVLLLPPGSIKDEVVEMMDGWIKLSY